MISLFLRPAGASARELLQYLLLDDLFELLDEPEDEANQASIESVVRYLLELNESDSNRQLPDSEEYWRQEAGPPEQQRLNDQLRSLDNQIHSHRSSRHQLECTRDAVLHWIHRFQLRQRKLLHDAGELPW